MKRNLLHDGLVAFSFPVSTDRIAVLHLPRDFMDDALLARAEKAEQERDTYKQDYLTRHERWRDAEARAEKAELALAEMREALEDALAFRSGVALYRKDTPPSPSSPNWRSDG